MSFRIIEQAITGVTYYKIQELVTKKRFFSRKIYQEWVTLQSLNWDDYEDWATPNFETVCEAVERLRLERKQDYERRTRAWVVTTRKCPCEDSTS